VVMAPMTTRAGIHRDARAARRCRPGRPERLGADDSRSFMACTRLWPPAR
jgi:hypothetical protein